VKHKLVSLMSCSLVAFTLVGCATYKTTLTNAEGQTTTCEASGKSGLVTGYYLRKGFEDCVANAKAQGFKPSEASNTASSQSTQSK